MFYPEDSLKRGGRFYLCWVADSWPLRFATITHRQLWSQDIRKICNDLKDVITNESGFPAKRFSLRLSSQLLRGLVRIYQRKAVVLLGDLCMINATVIKNANKKYILHEVANIVERPRLPFVAPEEPELEERVEELIQRSGNVVANVDEITLKEQTIPEIQILINDGFGEMREGLEQSVEAMRVGGLEPPADLSHELRRVSPHASHDRSRLSPHHAAMERISDLNLTMLDKSIGLDLVQTEGLQKDVPDIPEILSPALKHPSITKEKEPEISETPSKKSATESRKRQAEEEIVLEELQPAAMDARKQRRGLIVDRRCRLDVEQFRARLNCPTLCLRCKDSAEDVIKIRVPANAYFSRPCHGRQGIRSNLSQVLTQMFARNIAVCGRSYAQGEIEETVMRPVFAFAYTRPQLERIEEEVEEVPAPVVTPMQIQENLDVNMNVERMDIDLLPTQIIPRLSPAQKRPSDVEIVAKRQRSGYISFKESQRLLLETENAQEASKENIPANIMDTRESQKSLTAMLQEVGLADKQTSRMDFAEPIPTQRESKRARSDSSETPLGSLDRTKVSLGESDKTTDTERFLRNEWGTEGTMEKIMWGAREGLLLNVHTLVSKGPSLPGSRAVIAARCFASILMNPKLSNACVLGFGKADDNELKQHGLIDLRKDPETLEIVEIKLGARFHK